MAMAKDEWRRGWPTLLGSTLGFAAGVGLYTNANGFFIKPLAEAFGWSRGQISLGAVALLVGLVVYPWLGKAVDQRGPRPFILAGGILFAIAYLLLALMPGPFWVYIAIVAFIGVSAGPLTTTLVFTRSLVSVFDKSRGLALAIAVSGNVIVGIAVLPLLQHVIATYGWRAGYAVMAPVSLALGLASFFILGYRPAHAPVTTSAPTVLLPQAAGHSLREAATDVRFWLLGLSMVSVSVAVGGFAAQLQPQLSDLGVPGAKAAVLGAWYAGIVVVGRIGCGVLLDWLWPPAVASAALVLPVAGALMLMIDAPPFWTIAAGASLIALSQGADGDVLGFFIARYFGLKAYSVILSVLGMACGIALALGAVLGGYSFDRTGDYQLMLASVAVLSLISAIALLASGIVRGKSHAVPTDATMLAPEAAFTPQA